MFVLVCEIDTLTKWSELEQYFHSMSNIYLSVMQLYSASTVFPFSGRILLCFIHGHNSFLFLLIVV